MYWKIMIVTREYERFCDHFRKLMPDTFRRTVNYTHITDGFLSITIYPWHESTSFRGRRADLIYLDADLYDDEEMRYAIFQPCGTIKSIRELKNKFGWRD